MNTVRSFPRSRGRVAWGSRAPRSDIPGREMRKRKTCNYCDSRPRRRDLMTIISLVLGNVITYFTHRNLFHNFSRIGDTSWVTAVLGHSPHSFPTDSVPFFPPDFPARLPIFPSDFPTRFPIFSQLGSLFYPRFPYSVPYFPLNFPTQLPIFPQISLLGSLFFPQISLFSNGYLYTSRRISVKKVEAARQKQHNFSGWNIFSRNTEYWSLAFMMHFWQGVRQNFVERISTTRCTTS